MSENTQIVPSYENVAEFAKFFMQRGITQQQISYVIIAERKNTLFKLLQEKELESQKIILNPGEKIEEIEKSLKDYRAIHTYMVDKLRTPFTNFIRDNIAAPSMDFEKRVDPKTNDNYIDLDKKLIKLKEDDERDKAQRAKIFAEENQYLAHIKNQNAKRQSDFIINATKYITDVYSAYLEIQEQFPSIDKLKAEIKTFKLADPVVMKRLYVDDERAIKLIEKWKLEGEIFDLDVNELIETVLNTVDEVFASYQTDLELAKAKPEVLQEIKSQADVKVAEMQEEVKKEIAVNDVVATSIQHTSFAPSYKPLNVSYSIQYINSIEFTVKVITTFAQNINDLVKYLKVKTFANLSTSQMLSTFEKHAEKDNGGKKFDGFIYNEVKK